MKVRLDQLLLQRGLVTSRSQAESYIRLGKVSIRENPDILADKISRNFDEKTRERSDRVTSQAGC